MVLNISTPLYKLFDRKTFDRNEQLEVIYSQKFQIT